MVPGLHEGELVPLTQALGEWRQPTDATRFPQVAQEIHRLEAREAELVQEHQANIDLMNQNLSAMVAAVGEEDSIDWDQARAEMDPTEFNERKALFDRRKSAFRSAFQQVQEAKEGQAQRDQEARATRLQDEATRLLKIMPQWGTDQKLAASAKAQMSITAEAVGLTGDDLNEIVDHRHVLLLWKASEYDRLSQLKKTELPALKQLPRVSMRSGARAVAGAGSEDKRLKILASHRASGTQQSAASAIEAVLGDDL